MSTLTTNGSANQNPLFPAKQFLGEHIYVFNTTTTDDPENIARKRQRSVYRDKERLHRFWFQFPSEWRTSSNSERVLGLRSCTMKCGDRNCRFTLEISKTEVESGISTEIAIVVSSHLKTTEKLDALITDIRFYINKAREAKEEEWKEEGKPIIEETDIGYLFERNEKNQMCFVIDGRDQYNSYDSNSMDPLYTTELRMSDLNEDAKSLLMVTGEELPVEYSKKIVFPCVWDRNTILLKSNIAVNSCGNYVGYTDSTYDPIKYFKLSSNDAYFWIEMYNGNDHITPAIIPLDGQDSFLLEIVLLI